MAAVTGSATTKSVEEGTWDHDTIGFEAVNAGFPTQRIQVLASEPDACLVGLQVDARPSDRMDDEPIRLWQR